MRVLIFISLLFFPTTTYSQSMWNSFWSLSGPERCWVLSHLFVAGKARKITKEVRVAAEEMKSDKRLDGDAYGGRVDAFRHAYWMARLSQDMCWKKALSLGRAHEKGNYKQFKKGQPDEENALPDSASCAMDLYNNQEGVEIGCNNKSVGEEVLKNIIVKAISDGKMLIVSKNSHGRALDCEGKILDESEFKGKWNIPKCLIKSGF